MVLVSYPLVSDKGESRAEILLALPETVSVLFVVGDRDKMCPLSELEEVREKMEARSWLCVVKGADHGMNLLASNKDGEEHVGQMTGRVAAEWIMDGGKDAAKSIRDMEFRKGEGEQEGAVVVSEWREKGEENVEVVRKSDDKTSQPQGTEQEVPEQKEKDGRRRSSRKRTKTK